MEAYEDDDDTHFCIKCHSTVNGLDNYIRHRQSACRRLEAKQSEVIHDPPSTPTAVTYPEILNADTFFSSLELQSSTKSTPVPRSRTLVDRERKTGRNEDKNRKKIRRVHEPDDGGLKEKLLNMPPVVADMDDLMDHLGIPSLVGFPDIVTTTSGKSSTLAAGKMACAPSSTKVNNHENYAESPGEIIMASSKGCSERKRNENSQRVDQDHSGWLDDTILVDLDANSESKVGDHIELSSYGDYDYQQDEESDEESLDQDIDEDESSSNDDDAEDREYLPRGHTGGKWKPSELVQDISRLNEDESVDDEDNHEHPSPLHTGGKWKPVDSSQMQRGEESEVAGKDPGASSLEPVATTGRQPPPGHTRGKWIPGVPGDFGSGYWCDPCSRKLASRLLYNRHLLSDLHARRSIQEIDSDLQLPRGVRPFLQRKPASKRQRALAEIKSRTKILPSQDDNKESKKRIRRRQKEVLVCEMCQARVQRPQMGKHLLSHYHCRVAGANPCRNPAAQSFILENMGDVVRQCPFQCAICCFYCNTEETFLLHWRSELHTSKIEDIIGSYKCNPCDFYCEDNKTMDQHLMSAGHREIVVMMNGSVPVVIGKQRSIVCETCDQNFRFNLQLRFHTRETGHCGNVTASDEYQSRIACSLCSQVVRSLVALQRHQLSCHGHDKEAKEDDTKVVVQPGAPYFCSFCMLNFPTANDAVLHRRTSSHKEIVRAQKITSEKLTSQTRECPHCGAKQQNLLEHKEHLLQHPELCHRCPRCGMVFALPQDVTRHSRDGKCSKSSEEYVDRSINNDHEWRCTNCPFTTDSQAEFLFHDALHTGRVKENADEAGCSKALAKYRCPMCEKIFCKVTLRNHMRIHTGERPFRCLKCSGSFSRRSSLNIHRKECTSTSPSFSSSPAAWGRDAEANALRQRDHVCSECNTGFYTNRILSRYVTFRETYKKRKWVFFKKVVTRIATRRQDFVEWYPVKVCCTGYLQQRFYPLTCSPVCLNGCPHGLCREPDICTCNPGYRVSLIHGLDSCMPDCGGDGFNDDGCGDHAQCAEPAKCECDIGYNFTVKNLHPTDKPQYILPCIPMCDPECTENAYCDAPNICECNAGYRSARSNQYGNPLQCLPICEKACINGICLFPNTCSCFPGYKSHPTNNFICEPICENNCINANCAGPDLCECYQGYAKSSSDPQNLCWPICDPPCINANCTQPNQCECHQGYEKNPKDLSQVCLPVCHPSCINGNCTAPNHCECHESYGKNLDGPTHICSPVCDPPCMNANCAQPNHCECHDGFGKNSKDPSEVCSPVCNPPCINANCTQPNQCECYHGYQTDSKGELQVCIPVCDHPCINAICSQPNQCECHSGYEKNSTHSEQFCSPVCDPLCGSHAFCESPNKCVCMDGYIVASVTNLFLNNRRPISIINTTTKPLHTSSTIIFEDAITCQPLCEPECTKNASCIAPNMCQCDTGYRSASSPDRMKSVTQCFPVCEKNCINAFCGYPNKCICLPGYKPNAANNFVCDPACAHDCINGNCTRPNYCECQGGYKKAQSMPAESHQSVVISENLCIPICHEECPSANCVAPNQCIFNPGYTYVNTSTNTSQSFSQPLCEPPCPIGLECVVPDQCEPQFYQDQDQDNNEFSTNFPNVSDTTEDYSRNINLFNGNSTDVCRYGWTGWNCDEPSFCVMIFTNDNETDEQFSIIRSLAVATNSTDYDESNDTNADALDWHGPRCRDECRIFILSSESSGNISKEIIDCRQLEVFNATSDQISIETKSLISDGGNQTVVCFIKAGSKCNGLKYQLLDYHGTFYGIVGVATLLVVLILLASAIYLVYQKRRNTRAISDLLMNNSITTKWPDSTSDSFIESSSI